MNNEPNKKNGAKPAVAHKKNILDDRRIRLALSVLGLDCGSREEHRHTFDGCRTLIA